MPALAANTAPPAAGQGIPRSRKGKKGGGGPNGDPSHQPPPPDPRHAQGAAGTGRNLPQRSEEIARATAQDTGMAMSAPAATDIRIGLSVSYPAANAATMNDPARVTPAKM